MTTPVVVVVCLHVLHPPDFLHVTRTVPPPGLRVIEGWQSGLSGSDFVQAHDTSVVTPAPPPAIRAITITVDVTRRCPGRRTMRLRRGGDVRRRGCLRGRERCLAFIVSLPFRAADQ